MAAKIPLPILLIIISIIVFPFSVEASSNADKPSGDSSLPSLPVATAWRPSDDLDTQPIMSYDVPANQRSSVNKFIQTIIQISQEKTANFINGVIEKRLKDAQMDGETKDCLKTCKDVYEDAKDAMTKTLEDVRKGDYYKANVDVGAISSDAETCKDCVKTVYGEDPEMDRFNKWVDGVIDRCLTMITGYKS